MKGCNLPASVSRQTSGFSQLKVQCPLQVCVVYGVSDSVQAWYSRQTHGQSPDKSSEVWPIYCSTYRVKRKKVKKKKKNEQKS